MSFINITDTAKRDFIAEDFLRTKNNMRQNSLSEKMGDNLVKGLPLTYPPTYIGNEAVSWAQALELITNATTNSATVTASDNYLTNKKYAVEQNVLKVSKPGDEMTGKLLLNVGAA